MDFLDEIMSGMTAPKPRSSRALEVARQRRAIEAKERAQKKKEVDDITSSTIATITEFIKTGGDVPPYYKEFAPCNRAMRTIVHDVCSEHGLKSFSFGPEEEGQRRVIAFKEGREPMDHQLQLMDRSLPYKECMRQLAIENSRLTTEMREVAEQNKRWLERERLQRNKRKLDDDSSTSKKNFRQKLEKIAGDTSVQATSSKIHDSYGMVPTSMKLNKRTIEDVERDRELRKKKNDTKGEEWEEF